MAPRARRGDVAEPEAHYEFGKQGRKTGVVLPDGGERDEYGMQPIDNIFSSPPKAPAPASIHDNSGSEDMDIPSSAGPGPQTVLKGQRNIQYPIPRSRSPAKTHLMSPARRNPHIARTSSPAGGSGLEDESEITTAKRRLDFANRNSGRQQTARSKTNGTNGVSRPFHRADPDIDVEPSSDLGHALNDSLRLIDDVEDEVDLPPEVPDDVDEVDEVTVVKSAPAAKKGRGRPKGKPNRSSQITEPINDAEPSTVEEPIEEVQQQQQQQQPEEVDEAEEGEEPVKRRPGRPSRKDRSQPEPKPAQPTSRKRRSFRDSTGGEESDEQVEPQDEPPEEPARPPKKQRTQASANPKAPVPKATKPAKPTPPAAKAEAPAKSRGRPKKAAKEVETGEPEAGEASFMALQRGPPMPKARGLVSVRRDADSVTQTRSGRHSYRPLHWWRGDEVVRNEEEQGDLFYHDEFVVSSVKEVVRVPEEEAPSKRSSRGRPRSASAKPKTRSKQRRALLQDNEEPEEWELNEGNVMGEVVIWEPEHEQHPPADDEPVQITEDQIAISADAVHTTQIRDGTFRFAKTLTMPFMGSGIVDLPPGAEKRPKNSRKMHMVFFVHYGKVVVTVNEAQFRISAGGMWFVPRGNYYSISNDYDNPCRIFFAQACEVSPQSQVQQQDVPEMSQSMMSMA